MQICKLDEKTLAKYKLTPTNPLANLGIDNAKLTEFYVNSLYELLKKGGKIYASAEKGKIVSLLSLINSEWDTEILGLKSAKIANAFAQNYDEGYLLAKKAIEDNKEIGFIFTKVPVCQKPLASALCSAGFDKITADITLRATPKEYAIKTNYVVRSASVDDKQALQNITLGAYRNSRLYVDKNMPSGAGDKIYRCWVENAFNGAAGNIIVVENKNSVLGYITCVLDQKLEKYTNCRIGHIDLIAVDSNARAKGVGTLLVQSALGWFAKQKASYVLVETQTNNKAALKLYHNAGFKNFLEQFSLHYWRSK